MKTNLYCVTTKKHTFHVSASTLTYAVEKAHKHIDDIATIGVESPAITEIKYIGYYIEPKICR